MSSFKHVKLFSLRLIRACQVCWWQSHFVLNLQEVIYPVRGQLLDLSHDMHKINISSSFGSYSPACCLWLSWWPQAAPPVRWGKWDYSAFKRELKDEAVHKDCGQADGFLEDKRQMEKFPRCHAIINPSCSKFSEPNSVIGKASWRAQQRHVRRPCGLVTQEVTTAGLLNMPYRKDLKLSFDPTGSYLVSH